jgi:hypothetical protein
MRDDIRRSIPAYACGNKYELICDYGEFGELKCVHGLLSLYILLLVSLVS